MKNRRSARSIAFAIGLTLPLAAQTRRTSTQPTDWQIEAEVQAAISSEHAFRGSSILSSVNGGVVLLSGNVRSDGEKALATSELAALKGVKSVTNNLGVVDYSVHAAAPTPPGTAVSKIVTLPANSALPVRITEEINTKTAKAGDTFHGTTAANVTFPGTAYVALPIGTAVTGRIVAAKPAGRLSGAAELSIELVSVKISSETGSQETALVTQTFSSAANGRGANTAAKTGGGAALGAVIGAVAGGGKGAGIGAASGGVLGLGANALTHGQEIDLKPEQLIQFKTGAPINVAITTQAGQQIAAQGATGATLVARASTGMPSAELIDIPNQADPATYDILTLKLGMTAKEAATAITARIPGIQPAYPSPSDAEFTPGQRYTSAALYSTNRFKALLSFTESYPFDPARPEQLTSINYEAVTPTEADRVQLRNSIITKYGQPYREVKGQSALWCNKGTSLGSGPLACAPDVATLQLKGSELILSDSGPLHRERAIWNAKTTGAPPI